MTDINVAAAAGAPAAPAGKAAPAKSHGRASLVTIEMLNAILSQNLVALKAKIDSGADTNFVFGETYRCKEGYTPLMAALQVGNMDVCRQLLNSGANPNFVNSEGDAVVFWGIDSGVEAILLLHEFGVDLDLRTKNDWTPLQYARAVGKYGHPSNKGVYPEDVLKGLGAREYGSQPAAKRPRSPRLSYTAGPAAKRGPGQREDEEDEDGDIAGALDNLGGRGGNKGAGLALGLGPPAAAMGGGTGRGKDATPAVTPVQAALANIMSQAAANQVPVASPSRDAATGSPGAAPAAPPPPPAGEEGAGGVGGASETESEGNVGAGGAGKDKGGDERGKDLKLGVGGGGGDAAVVAGAAAEAAEGAAAGAAAAAGATPARVGALSLGAGFLGR